MKYTFEISFEQLFKNDIMEKIFINIISNYIENSIRKIDIKFH